MAPSEAIGLRKFRFRGFSPILAMAPSLPGRTLSHVQRRQSLPDMEPALILPSRVELSDVRSRRGSGLSQTLLVERRPRVP